MDHISAGPDMSSFSVAFGTPTLF